MRTGPACGPALLLALAACCPCLAENAPSPEPADRFACDALKAIDLREALGTGVRLVEVGILPATGDQPELCRVNGIIEPQVGFEVRMPVRGWNGKLLVTGCSNLCGVLQIVGMEDALARGYAAATTDMGHQTADTSDARWAFNNPTLEIDFGHRATHVTTVAARELVANYYGNPPNHAYFRGCSTGGRQGLVAAERYPEDFDGIIAGAPFNQSLSVPQMAWALAANAGPGGEPLLGKADMELLGKAALVACDAADGERDGVIGNPESCGFRPEELQCPATTDDGKQAPREVHCLTPAQVEAAAKIYSGPRSRAGAAWSSAGAAIGSESGWEKNLLAPPGRLPFFQFVVRNWSRYLAWEPDPPLPEKSSAGGAGREPKAIDFDAGPAQFAATAAVAGFKGDLERFRALGGRLLIYHGWADESLMPAHTLDYWRDAAERLGGGERGPQRRNEFARLFLVPGMLHCGGGPGAADIDYLSALERWVEAGEAPESLLAYKTKNAVPSFVREPRFPPPASTVEFTRRILPYSPATAP